MVAFPDLFFCNSGPDGHYELITSDYYWVLFLFKATKRAEPCSSYSQHARLLTHSGHYFFHSYFLNQVNQSCIYDVESLPYP